MDIGESAEKIWGKIKSRTAPKGGGLKMENNNKMAKLGEKMLKQAIVGLAILYAIKFLMLL